MLKLSNFVTRASAKTIVMCRLYPNRFSLIQIPNLLCSSKSCIMSLVYLLQNIYLYLYPISFFSIYARYLGRKIVSNLISFLFVRAFIFKCCTLLCRLFIIPLGRYCTYMNRWCCFRILLCIRNSLIIMRNSFPITHFVFS